MKRIKRIRLTYLFTALAFITLTGIAQSINDIQTITVNKLVKDYPVEYKQDTPLDAYLSTAHIFAYGKNGLWRSYSTYRFYHLLPKEDTPDANVTDKEREEVLNREIKECIIYRDSVAAVITTSDEDSLYYIRYLSKEDNKWVNASENFGRGFEKTKENVMNYLPTLASFIPMMTIIKQKPTDTLAFVNYLKAHGQPPHRYIINKLSKHKLVIYGEHHRRKVSWDLLTRVIHEPDFVETTGTVFFELPSHKQKDLDRFYTQKTLDKRILLDIFGSEVINGWQDKDEFNFMIALWELNTTLPENRKIKVVLTDDQIPWDSIHTPEELKKVSRKDRNTNMADVIEQTIQTTTDKRNALFIVGYMHVYKSPRVPGMFSAPQEQQPALSAGAQLVERLSNENVFCLFPHCMSGSNRGQNGGKIRHGLFDYVFDVNKNVPVAFDLAGSPFGKEPFDASLEVKFNDKIGRYEDNFDGYIFFLKLEEEEKGNPLYELFTDEYVEEIKRRVLLTGVKEDQPWGYNTTVKGLTKEIITAAMKQYAAKREMWD